MAVGVVGVLASVMLADSLLSRETQLFDIEFEHRFRDRALVIERELRGSLTEMESIAALFAASQSVDRQEFRAFTSGILQQHPAILALGYDQVVLASERAEHEATVRQEGFTEFQITERSPDGRLIPAATRDSHVVVTYLEPLEGNELALGYDIASEAIRLEGISRARDTGSAAITGPLTLVQQPSVQTGVMILVPIYSHSPGEASAAGRGNPRGFAVGVLRVNDLVELALSSLQPVGIGLRLTDDDAAEGKQLLYLHRSRALAPLADPGTSDFVDGAVEQKSYSFAIGGRTWTVQGAPTAAFAARQFSWAPAAVLSVGLVLTALLCGYLARLASVNRRVRRALSEQKRAEDRQAGFGRMVDEAHDEIYVFGAESLKFLHANRGALENNGYSMSELRQMTPLDLKPRMTSETFAEVLRPLRQEAQPKVEFTTVHRRKDGSQYDVDVHLQRSIFDGVPAFMAVILDITERKRFEERFHQSQRIEALGTLAGGIAHDFNNLLMAIMGYAELCQREESPSKIRDDLGEIIRASERARGLVSQILDFSRRSSVELQQIDLRELVKEVLSLVRVSAPADIVISETLPEACEIVGDPTQIHQVLMNLCTNAVHAMRDGGGKLEVCLASETLSRSTAIGDLAPGSYARLSVGDGGHGIEPEILLRVFDPFFTTKARGEGTGMGLSVAHGIVTKHAGALTAMSEPGRGTTFHVYLPLGLKLAESVERSEPSGAGNGESILLVDDDPSVGGALSRMLRRLGYEVEAYTSSIEALHAVREHAERFDLAITDYNMPDLMGTKFAQELRSIAPALPVILVSGFGNLLDEDEVRNSYVRGVLTKPLRMQELGAAIRQVMDG